MPPSLASVLANRYNLFFFCWPSFFPFTGYVPVFTLGKCRVPFVLPPFFCPFSPSFSSCPPPFGLKSTDPHRGDVPRLLVPFSLLCPV